MAKQEESTKAGSSLRMVSDADPIRTEPALSAYYHEKEDRARRKMNVIISGLPEVPGASPDVEVELVRNLCRDELQCSPAFVQARAQRLGKPDAIRPRKLRVTLESSEEKTKLLLRAPSLRNSTDLHVSQHIFIGPDLTKAESDFAYTRRRERRARTGGAGSMNPADGIKSRPIATSRLNAQAKTFVHQDCQLPNISVPLAPAIYSTVMDDHEFPPLTRASHMASESETLLKGYSSD